MEAKEKRVVKTYRVVESEYEWALKYANHVGTPISNIIEHRIFELAKFGRKYADKQLKPKK